MYAPRQNVINVGRKYFAIIIRYYYRAEPGRGDLISFFVAGKPAMEGAINTPLYGGITRGEGYVKERKHNKVL